MTVTDRPADPTSTRERLLAELRRCEVDVAAARQRLEARLRADRRRRRTLLGSGVVAVAVALVGGLLALGGDDPDDVLADRTEPTSTTAPTSTTTPGTADPLGELIAEEAPTAAPDPEVPPAEVLAPPVETAPETVATLPPTTTTTSLTNLPMQVALDVMTPRVSAGSTTVVRIRWADQDHAGAPPTYVVDWGDPALEAPAPPLPPTAPCDRPGAPADGADRLEFRHATPGRHVVRVQGVTCGGRGAFAERFTLEGVVEVVEPDTQGTPAVAVVLHRDPQESSRLLLPALDAATATFVSGDGVTSVLGPRVPGLSQRVDGGAATVVVLPRAASGAVELSWPSTSCRASAEVDTSDISPGSAPRFVLRSAC